MATSEFWQRISASVFSEQEWAEGPAKGAGRGSRGKARLQMALDAVTIAVSVTLATLCWNHIGLLEGAGNLWRGTFIHSRSMEILLALLCFYALSLMVVSRHLNLYSTNRCDSIFHEQFLSIQACLTSGLLLTGVLYMVHAENVSRIIVLATVGLVAIGLSLRRLISRLLRYRRFKRGLDTRNVLIVGTGPKAQALRHHLESVRHLGYAFKGFIELPGAGSYPADSTGAVLGTLDTLFKQARKKFVDEIFITMPCERGIIQKILAQARAYGVDLRIIPETYDGLTWNNPVEYLGHFPTIPLYRGQTPVIRLALKRTLDILFSILALIFFLPAMAVIAIAIKLDSSGPVFYLSERIGKKGRVFRCIKFRTMVRDADKRRASLMQRNEREEVLFKIANDPRVTRVGHFLRKYSLDEFPQFFNVLRGDMSVVGPRPPIGSEVREYQLSHLRRLDVTPGITGLWQVQARQSPSFDSYISLDVTYIENWSVWLDFQIILRTVGVVLAGTGS